LPPSLPCHFSPPTPPTPETYTLSLHDALPIFWSPTTLHGRSGPSSTSDCPAPLKMGNCASRISSRKPCTSISVTSSPKSPASMRSEEHTSELQSRENLVCRLLLEKKK